MTVSRLVLRRLGWALVTLLLVSLMVFVTAELLPGDPGRTILGPYASEEQVAALNEQLGEDDPAVVRYADWVSDFVRGDWGTSEALRQPVRSLTSRAPRCRQTLWKARTVPSSPRATSSEAPSGGTSTVT